MVNLHDNANCLTANGFVSYFLGIFKNKNFNVFLKIRKWLAAATYNTCNKQNCLRKNNFFHGGKLLIGKKRIVLRAKFCR